MIREGKEITNTKEVKTPKPNVVPAPQSVKRPPIGLIPKYIWISQRIMNINNAINRYNEVQKEVPIEWYLEKAELLMEHYELTNQTT